MPVLGSLDVTVEVSAGADPPLAFIGRLAFVHDASAKAASAHPTQAMFETLAAAS
jgi:hypothetical protein